LIFPDSDSLIRRSPASAPLLDSLKDRKTRDAVKSVIERLTGSRKPTTEPTPQPQAAVPQPVLPAPVLPPPVPPLAPAAAPAPATETPVRAPSAGAPPSAPPMPPSAANSTPEKAD
jgi:AsmA protein